ncbi:MAG TPA: hypothetical protein VL988_10465 [Solirubrobacteraceae bacterium]|nr:hypothetical protein [Solirubrobacteraceae bacterium]
MLFLALALATLAALAALLSAPAQSLARHARATTHAGAARHKPASKHAKHKHHVKKPRKHKAKHGSAKPATPAPKPATCEDGSRPVNEGEGSFSCADGGEPVCTNGVEPTPTRSGSKPVCPVTTSSTTEFTEAECEDGSPPERSDTGAFVCEDSSRPACPDGSQPTLSDDGSMLACLAQVTNGSAPSSPPEEEDEGEGEPASSVRVAIGS